MVSAGASILGPVTIGEHSKIGAGSVVLKDIPPHSTVVGVPGRVVRQNGKKVEDEMQYPGMIKVNVIRESRVVDYAK